MNDKCPQCMGSCTEGRYDQLECSMCGGRGRVECARCAVLDEGELCPEDMLAAVEALHE
jgi:DnaJ-class molecular chaperone